MWEALGLVVAGFLLGQVEAWRREWKAGQAEERKAALSVRQAALILIGEMSSAQNDAKAMQATGTAGLGAAR